MSDTTAETPTSDTTADGSALVFADLDPAAQETVDSICTAAVLGESEFPITTWHLQINAGELVVPAFEDAAWDADDEAAFLEAVAPICEASDWTP